MKDERHLSSDEESDLASQTGGDLSATVQPKNISEYTPPEDFAPLQHTGARSKHFDASTIEDDDDKELWLIKIPEKLKLSAFKNVSVQLPKDLTDTAPLATIDSDSSTLNHAKFTLHATPTSALGEMEAFEVLLPSLSAQKTTKYVRPAHRKPSQKAFAQYFTLSQDVELPDSADAAQKARDRAYAKREHPQGLKMRFRPYGFDDELDEEERVESRKNEDPAPTSLSWVNSAASTSSTTPKKPRKDSSAKSRSTVPASATPKSPEKKKKKAKTEEHADASTPKKSKASSSAAIATTLSSSTPVAPSSSAKKRKADFTSPAVGDGAGNSGDDGGGDDDDAVKKKSKKSKTKKSVAGTPKGKDSEA